MHGFGIEIISGLKPESHAEDPIRSDNGAGKEPVLEGTVGESDG